MKNKSLSEQELQEFSNSLTKEQKDFIYRQYMSKQGTRTGVVRREEMGAEGVRNHFRKMGAKGLAVRRSNMTRKKKND